jgi:hypothetical protein
MALHWEVRFYWESDSREIRYKIGLLGRKTKIVRKFCALKMRSCYYVWVLVMGT